MLVKDDEILVLNAVVYNSYVWPSSRWLKVQQIAFPVYCILIMKAFSSSLL